jgi:hypothetical protein
MLVNIERYSMEFNGKRALNKNISKIEFFYGFLDNPRHFTIDIWQKYLL